MSPQDAVPPLAHRTAGGALAALAGAQFTVILSTSIVNVALPSVRAGIGLTEDGAAWVVNAYGLAFGALLLAGGRLADLAGRRRVLLAGLALFAAASAAAGLAPTAAALIVARTVQGLAAAAIAPAALALLMDLHPPGPGRGRALGVWGAVSGAGGAAGVLLGGALTQALGWPWTFHASALGAALVLAATAVVVPPDPSARRAGGGLDLPGTAIAALGLTALVWALTAARRTGWTGPQVLVALATAAALLPLFVRLERRHPHPLLPPRLLRTGRVAAGNLLMALLGSVWIALFYLLPLYQQRVLGDGPLAAGLGQLPLAAANMAGSWLAPRVARRFGAAPVLAAALLTEAAGLLWLTRISADGSFAVDLLGPSIAVGLGLGAAFAQLTGIAVTGVAPADSGLAGGLVNTTRQVGGAIGLAVLGTLAAAVTAGAAPTRPPLDALTAGYRAAFLGGALVLALAAALALLLLRHPRPTAQTRTHDVRTRHAHHVHTHHQGDHAMPAHTHTIDTTAPVVVRLATTVDAPPALVWALHTDVEAWPRWNPDIEQARLDGGPLTGPGTSFSWRTHGLDITSTVRELVPGRRIVWGGPANGIEGIHVWSFEPAGDGRVTVRTEESWSGPAVEAMPEALEQALRESLERWLDHLRTTAESAHRAATAG